VLGPLPPRIQRTPSSRAFPAIACRAIKFLCEPSHSRIGASKDIRCTGGCFIPQRTTDSHHRTRRHACTSTLSHQPSCCTNLTRIREVGSLNELGCVHIATCSLSGLCWSCSTAPHEGMWRHADSFLCIAADNVPRRSPQSKREKDLLAFLATQPRKR